MKYSLLISFLCFFLIGFSQNIAKHYYVVVQAFRNEVNAKQYQRDMNQKGYNATIFYNTERDFYYIYFEDIATIQTATKEKEILRSSGFENAWVYVK